MGITCGCKWKANVPPVLFYIRMFFGLLSRIVANRKIEMFLKDFLSGIVTGKSKKLAFYRMQDGGN